MEKVPRALALQGDGASFCDQLARADAAKREPGKDHESRTHGWKVASGPTATAEPWKSGVEKSEDGGAGVGPVGRNQS